MRIIMFFFLHHSRDYLIKSIFYSQTTSCKLRTLRRLELQHSLEKKNQNNSKFTPQPRPIFINQFNFLSRNHLQNPKCYNSTFSSRLRHFLLLRYTLTEKSQSVQAIASSKFLFCLLKITKLSSQFFSFYCCILSVRPMVVAASLFD